MRKVAFLTSGGDSSGMNSGVRAMVKFAIAHGIEPFLVYDGYFGLHQGRIEPVDSKLNVDDFNGRGGTFINSSRYPDFTRQEVREETKARLNKMGIDAIVVIGGDGSYRGAQLLHELGIKAIALPGTIDNDISSSDFTIGYDTALNTIVENVERVRDTMRSHNRGAIVEVMGHGCGDLALFSALATGAELVVTNENIISEQAVVDVFVRQFKAQKRSVIAIVSEMIYPDLKALAKLVTEKCGHDVRSIVLGHVQRGGTPTAQERVNASLMGMKAIELLKANKSGLAVGILKGEITATPILEALSMPRTNRVELAEKINKLNQS